MADAGPPARVDPDAFRAAVSDMASGVSVVSTTLRGVEHAITATSFTWVSVEPPLLLACVHEDARFLDAVTETGTWGLSLLPAGARAVAAWLATPGRPARGQLDRVPHTAGAATGAPLLDGALAAFECRTSAVHPGGDHVIIVGEVVALVVHTPGGAGTGPGPGPGPASGPLVRFRGSYHALP